MVMSLLVRCWRSALLFQAPAWKKRLLLSYDAMRARRNVLCFVAYSIAPLLAAVRANFPHRSG
jgi:hypothetical protein